MVFRYPLSTTTYVAKAHLADTVVFGGHGGRVPVRRCHQAIGQYRQHDGDEHHTVEKLPTEWGGEGLVGSWEVRGRREKKISTGKVGRGLEKSSDEEERNISPIDRSFSPAEMGDEHALGIQVRQRQHSNDNDNQQGTPNHSATTLPTP